MESPLSIAIYLENLKIIKTAAHILCQAFPEVTGGDDHPSEGLNAIDAHIALQVRKLGIFRFEGAYERKDVGTSGLKELLDLQAGSWKTDRTRRELYTFASALQDGTVLCQ